MARQHCEFLAGDRAAFDLPLEDRGREFDRRVWEMVAGVPYGETTTYGELARSLGDGAERDAGRKLPVGTLRNGARGHLVRAREGARQAISDEKTRKGTAHID